MKKNKFIIFFRIFSIIVIIICLIALFMWQKDNSSNSDIQDDLSNLVLEKEIEKSNESENETPDDMQVESNSNSTPEDTSDISDLSVDFDTLIAKNDQTVGWVKINKTNINYPIVQAQDNSYYLKRNFYKEKNSAGWIYADYRNNFETLDKNTIIYGHNRRNGTMFSNLNYYLKSDWYTNEENKYFNFVTKSQSYIAEIFSVYKVSASTVNLSNTFSSDEEFEENINAWKSASIYDFKTDVTIDDNLLTLYTCDNNNSYRIIIVSKLIPTT